VKVRHHWPNTELAKIWATLLVVIVVGSSACRKESADGSSIPAHGTPPNVILVSIDTLRADHMSLYGYSRSTTPFLEELAEDAIVFDQFSQNGGGTLPSHVTMLTSLYPRTHQIFPGRDVPMPESMVTLAEHLKIHRYETGGFVDCIWLTRKFGFSQGFDHFDDQGGNIVSIGPKVFDWLHDQPASPFFLFLHVYDVHSKPDGLPYHCPEPFFSENLRFNSDSFDGCRSGLCATRFLRMVNARLDEGKEISDFLTPEEIKFLVELYDTGIAYIDEQMRLLIEELKSLGLYDNSLIVVTADHGENFMEHNRLLHSLGLYDTVTQVPLIIKMPEDAFGGTRVPHIASIVDIVPTILDIVGLPALPVSQGKSLVPMFAEDLPISDEVYIWQALRTERWKYVKTRGELFDLQDDPGERLNQASAHPDLVKAFDEKLQALETKAVADRADLKALSMAGEGSTGLSEEEIDQLKSLGYLDGDQ